MPDVTNLWRVSVGNVNWSRVLIGGIAAAVVMMLFDVLGMAVLGMDMEAWLTQHQLTQPSIVIWIAVVVVFGILIAWLYAAIRPRFGPGPKTALMAAAFIWILFGAIYAMFTAMGLYTQTEYFKFAAWGALQLAAAANVAAWLYREGDGVAAPRM